MNPFGILATRLTSPTSVGVVSSLRDNLLTGVQLPLPAPIGKRRILRMKPALRQVGSK